MSDTQTINVLDGDGLDALLVELLTKIRDMYVTQETFDTEVPNKTKETVAGLNFFVDDDGHLIVEV